MDFTMPIQISRLYLYSILNLSYRCFQSTLYLALPSPQSSLMRAADALRVTWYERVFESLKRIDREGLGRRRTKTKQLSSENDKCTSRVPWR